MKWNSMLAVLSVVATILFSTAVPSAYAWTVYDDTHTKWQYTANWAAMTGIGGASGGTLHWSNVTGAEATFPCTAGGSGAYGQAVDLTFSRAYNRGIADIWLTTPSYPGAIFGLEHLDMYGSGISRQHVYHYSTGDLLLGSGSPYTVHIRVSGSRNAASSNYFVDIDALECLLS